MITITTPFYFRILIFSAATIGFINNLVDGHYVKTEMYERAKKPLAEKNLVVLTGYPGEGKTAMSAHLALEGDASPENCIKLECSRDWEEIDWSMRFFTTVIIDDIFGGESLDPEKLKVCLRILSN